MCGNIRNLRKNKEEWKLKLKGKELGTAIYDYLKKETERPLVQFRFEEEKAGILDSKIAGDYYLPTEMDVPRNLETDEELYLLAQINFSQIPPLKEYPKTGLLQIFVSADNLYGCDYDEEYPNQTTWRVRYIEDLPEETEISKEQIHVAQYPIDDKDFFGLPFEESSVKDGSLYQLKPELKSQPMTFTDRQFDDIFEKCCEELGLEDLEDVYDLYDTDKEAYDQLCDLVPVYICQVGGYPYFVQDDIREEDGPDILLLRIDTAGAVEWGSAGAAHFFISKKDLLNKDFSNVLYWWDCD